MPPSAMRVSMSKPTHQPHGYAWFTLAIVAMPVAKRTTVVTTVARTTTQRTSATGRHQPGGLMSGMLFLVVLVVSPEPESPADDHGDDRHGHPHGREDLRREVEELRRQNRRRLLGQVGRIAELL